MLANTHFCKGCLQVLQDVYTEIYWGKLLFWLQPVIVYIFLAHALQRDESIMVSKMCVLLKKCYLSLHILFPSHKPILRCSIHNFPKFGTCLFCVWVGSKNLILEKWVQVAHVKYSNFHERANLCLCRLYAPMHTSWTDAWFCCCYRFQFLEILQGAIMVLRSGFNICPF
jgi:hypothetical protein